MSILKIPEAKGPPPLAPGLEEEVRKHLERGTAVTVIVYKMGGRVRKSQVLAVRHKLNPLKGRPFTTFGDAENAVAGRPSSKPTGVGNE